jgi:hypothetical protein
VLPRDVAPIVAVVVTLTVGGIGIAQGSSHPSDYPAKAAKGKKKRHALDVDYKTNEITVISEGEGSSDVQLSDEAKLAGRPFGSFKAQLHENRFFTWNIPSQNPRTDYSASEQVSFKAGVFGSATSKDSTFRGFWNYSRDSEGNFLNPITGVITGGSGKLKGAGGTFEVLDLHDTSTDPERQAGHWKGFIRY